MYINIDSEKNDVVPKATTAVTFCFMAQDTKTKMSYKCVSALNTGFKVVAPVELCNEPQYGKRNYFCIMHIA